MTGGQGVDYAFEDGPAELTWREVFATLLPARLRQAGRYVAGKHTK